jgi:hypothetical protein
VYVGRHGSGQNRGRARIHRITVSRGRLARVRQGTAFRPGAGRHIKRNAMKTEQTVPFVVGRLGKNDKRLMVLDDKTPPPIQGPFELRAVFSK